jgi:probable phosphoglycerate mutase
VTELYLRIRETLGRLAERHPVGRTIVVTHGGAVRVASTTADPVRGEPVPHGPVDNASITTFVPAGPATS